MEYLISSHIEAYRHYSSCHHIQQLNKTLLSVPDLRKKPQNPNNRRFFFCCISFRCLPLFLLLFLVVTPPKASSFTSWNVTSDTRWSSKRYHVFFLTSGQTYEQLMKFQLCFFCSSSLPSSKLRGIFYDTSDGEWENISLFHHIIFKIK